jgi:hypothetical protein
MPDSDLEARVSALEARVAEVAADATAARHLAAANDRDYADLAIKLDALRGVVNAHGVQTADRFDRLEREMRTGFAQTAAGHQQIVELLTGRIERGDDR